MTSHRKHIDSMTSHRKHIDSMDIDNDGIKHI
jgi:hypothetical protein